MLFERQWNLVVELKLAGRTAQYIADRFDCLILTIRRIRKGHRETSRWQRLPGSGRPKTTASDERYTGRLGKHIWFRSLAQVTQEFDTHLEHPFSKTNCPWSGNLQPCCCEPLGKSYRTLSCTCQNFKWIFWDCYKILAYCNDVSLVYFIHFFKSQFYPWSLRTSLNAKVRCSPRQIISNNAIQNKWIVNRI